MSPLTGAYNFRDLGGLPTVDGGTTRRGRLFRSDTLQELTDADAAVLADELGVRVVVDLRAPEEIASEGEGPLPARGTEHHYFSLLQEDTKRIHELPESETYDIVARYLDYLASAAEPVVGALEVLSRADERPTVFHCAAGKDRTGVIAALVLSIAGVTPEAIVADYAATGANMPRILSRLSSRPVYSGNVRALPAAVYEAHPESMQGFLAALQERHGGARAWAHAHGASEETLDRLTRVLRED